MLPHSSFAFDGIIWQVFADTPQAVLVLEVRHSNHTVSFAAVDIARRTLLWDRVSLPEAWWSSGILVHNGILFVQTFPDGQNPEPQGIIALEISTKKILWQKDGVQFVQLLADNHLLARILTADEPSYYLLNMTTGQVLDTQQPPFGSSPQLSSVHPLHFPMHYTSDDTYFQTIAAFLQQTLKISPKIAFDYAEAQQRILISYYLYADNQTENYLVVFDTHSRVPLLHEKLATQRTGIGKDTFFIFDKFLIFVKEHSFLLSYEI